MLDFLSYVQKKFKYIETEKQGNGDNIATK